MKNLNYLYYLLQIFFILIVFKLIYLNFFSPYLNSRNQHFQSNLISPIRGGIYDRNLEPLALSFKKYRLILDKSQVQSTSDIQNFLTRNFDYPIATLEAKFASNAKWINLGVNIDQEQKSSLTIPKGIAFETEYFRSYPDASLSSHLLGFLGKNSENINHGYFGLEGYYDEELKGLPGIIQSEQNIKGLAIIAGARNVIFGENGHDLITTIDKNIQYFSKKRLQAGMEKYQAQSGCIIVANPNNGAIIALSCLPDFDPNEYYIYNSEFYKNPSISNLFEPGSIFKPVVMAQAFQSGVLKRDSLFNESGPKSIGSALIKTWDEKYEGQITMQRIIEKSSNVGMVYVGEKLGKDNFYAYIKKLGIFEKTNIDLQGEVSAKEKPINSYYDLDFAAFTFGQGLAMTPLRALTIFMPLINGGNFVYPHVLDYSRSTDNDKIEKNEAKKYRIFSPEVSREMKEILFSTVNNGEAKYKIPKTSTFGGKTGTAQIALQGEYENNNTVASFIGFFPLENPDYIILTCYFRPQTSIYGSETAAPTFFELANDIISYQN